MSGPAHVAAAASPWLQKMQAERDAWKARWGIHADDLIQRVGIVGSRAPFRDMDSLRYGDPLASMVNLIATNEMAEDRTAATRNCETLARFVSALLAEGTRDLSLAVAVHMDVSKLFSAVMREATGTRHYNAAAMLLVYATDWLARGMEFTNAKFNQDMDEIRAIGRGVRVRA